MSYQIDLPENIYTRLANLAKGFDTPANVIERLLDHYQESTDSLPERGIQVRSTLPSKVDIEILPDPDTFKKQLLEEKSAWVLLHYVDGTSRLHEWRTHRFSESSDVILNLRSGYLRGWREKGIVKTQVSIHRDDLEK